MKVVNFEKIKSKEVFCLFSEPEITQKQIVIMSHGFRDSSIGPARTFVDFEQILLKAGISVLRFDQPNSGNSNGDYLNSSFNEWVDTTTYFAKKFIDKEYKVALLGQSMGATTSAVASARIELKQKIKCLLLWVPDPKSTFSEKTNQIYEEGGQKYKGRFWQEAKNSDFFDCLEKFKGVLHLVYGEKDRYVSKELRNQVVKKVKEKKQPVMILRKQDHSPWKFDISQEVYKVELDMLQKCFS